MAQSGSRPSLSNSGKTGQTETKVADNPDLAKDETPEIEPNTLPDEGKVDESALESERKRDKTLAEKLESGEFDDTDADDDPEGRGWIVHRTNDGGQVKEHRVPVQHWKRYSEIHNL